MLALEEEAERERARIKREKEVQKAAKLEEKKRLKDEKKRAKEEARRLKKEQEEAEKRALQLGAFCVAATLEDICMYIYFFSSTRCTTHPKKQPQRKRLRLKPYWRAFAPPRRRSALKMKP